MKHGIQIILISLFAMQGFTAQAQLEFKHTEDFQKLVDFRLDMRQQLIPLKPSYDQAMKKWEKLTNESFFENYDTQLRSMHEIITAQISEQYSSKEILAIDEAELDKQIDSITYIHAEDYLDELCYDYYIEIEQSAYVKKENELDFQYGKMVTLLQQQFPNSDSRTIRREVNMALRKRN